MITPFDLQHVQNTNGVITLAQAATAGDAFGRSRVSMPETLFDSKQLFDDVPLYFDDQEVSGSGTTSSHSADRASTTLGVGATTAGKRVRQTFQRFNYQPGKSQLVLCTGVLDASGGGTGIQAAMGYFDDKNGIFIKYDEGTLKIVKRSYVTGSAVDTEVSQASWNGDVLDGTGESGVTLDPAAAQIFWIDLEWLGVGSVRCGFVVDGAFIVAHTFHHANSVTSVYMSTANLPIRYEIENDGTGAASTLETICSTVISEGGSQKIGELHYESTGGTHIDANAANTIYACIGLRLRAAYVGNVVEAVQISVLATTSDDFEWMLIWNPTVAGTFTYSDKTNSGCQTAVGATANTVTGGTQIIGGFVKASSAAGSFSKEVENALRLGAAIDGTVDELVLCVRPLSANADIEASLTWRELV